MRALEAIDRSKAPPAALSALLLVGLVVGCATTPARRAVDGGAVSLITQLGDRKPMPLVAVVGGVRELGERVLPASDELARQIEHELTFALHEDGLRIVDHLAMDAALEVLRIEASDLFPDAEDGPENIRRVGRFLKADIFVTGEYDLLVEGELALDLKALDIETLELIATARAESRGRVQRTVNGVLYGGAVATVPLPFLWDICVEVSETCFDRVDDPGLGDMLLGWVMVPFYLPASPFLADYRATRWWLQTDDEDEEPGYRGPPPARSDGSRSEESLAFRNP